MDRAARDVAGTGTGGLIMRVLIATDLSDASLAGLECVCACGSGVFTHATLLHVIDLDLYTAGGSVPQILEYAHTAPEWADRLRGCGLETDVRVEQGSAVETIEQVADEVGADLVVMTSLGHGAATGRIFGSTVEKVASRGHVPVLVERVAEREGAWCRCGGSSPFGRVLVAAELDDAASALLAHVGKLPKGSAIRVIHVAAAGDDVAHAEAGLSDLVAKTDIPAAETAILTGDPTDVIVQDAVDWKATVVVVAACRHSPLHRAVWGSVARGVALHAPCSVLIVPPDIAKPA
jgi:nucleotide-binding universal stress UspA family protein